MLNLKAYHLLAVAQTLTGDWFQALDTERLAREALAKASLTELSHTQYMSELTIIRRVTQAAVKEQREEKDALMQRLRPKRRRISPAFHNTTLPGDIIITIGLHAMIDNPDVAVVLAGVCRYWRETVCSAPPLWSHLLLDGEASEKKVALWRERCKGRLVKFEVRESFDFRKRAHLLRSMQDLVGQLQHLVFINEYDFGNLVDWAERFERLEDVIVIHKGPYNYSENRTRFEAVVCNALSTLRRIHIERTDLYLKSKPKNWSVTSATFLQADIDQRLLDHMPNLENFEMVGCRQSYSVDGDRDEDGNSHLLPRVRRYRGGYNFFHLSKLKMPRLLELDLYGLDARTSMDWADINLRLLTFIDLGCSGFDDVRLSQILPELEGVQFLGLSATPVGDETLGRLTRGVGATEKARLCPNLVALSLSETRVSACAVVLLVNSRLPQHQRITVDQIEGRIQTPGGAVYLLHDEAAFVAEIEQSAHVVHDGPRIDWLCLDECGAFDPRIVDALRGKVTFLSAAAGDHNEDRSRCRGEYRWETIVQRSERVSTRVRESTNKESILRP